MNSEWQVAGNIAMSPYDVRVCNIARSETFGGKQFYC